MKEYLLKLWNRYPLMKTEDFLKLLYQTSFGPKHLHTTLDPNRVRTYLEKELSEVVNASVEDVEIIGPSYSRIYLSSIFNHRYTIEELTNLFLESANEEVDMDSARNYFFQGLDVLTQLVLEESIFIPKEEFHSTVKKYLERGIQPIHHSNQYREAYHPHYRVISNRYITIKKGI